MLRRKGLRLPRHAVEMVRHLALGPRRLARGDGLIDRFVLAERSFGASRLREQRAADALEMGSDRIEHFAEARQVLALGQCSRNPEERASLICDAAT